MAASSTTASQMASSRIAASNLYSWQNSLRRNWMPRQPLLFTYWLLRHPVFWFNSFFPRQSIRLPLVTYPWLCITYVTYRTLCDAIVYQELPNQPSPRKAENFHRGEKNFKNFKHLYASAQKPNVLLTKSVIYGRTYLCARISSQTIHQHLTTFESAF